ncbi:MAG TPA: DUF2255 family protein [Candidatus Limnocylindrales bacterium]|nr:DUF2255 family protein [Candidatus Limnocylindrales bacterium]
MPFSRDDLDLLERIEEVRIETSRPDGRRPRTIIWVMTDGDDVFVRSVRGERGRWYRAALVDPQVTIHADDRSIAARAIPATDGDSIARCSAALERKYAADSSLASMLEPKTLGTTLRLEPA